MPAIWIDLETERLIAKIQSHLSRESKKKTGMEVISPPTQIIKSLCKSYIEREGVR